MADLSPEQFEELLQKNRDKSESYADNSASDLLDSAFLGPGAKVTSSGNDFAKRNDIKTSDEEADRAPAVALSSDHPELDAILNPMRPQFNMMSDVAIPQPDTTTADPSKSAPSVTRSPASDSSAAIAVPNIPTKSSKSLTDDEMQNAIAQRRQNMGMLGMLQGANTIGSAFAQVKPDENYTKGLQGLANMPVEDIKQGREALMNKMALDEEKAKNDPTSQNSIMAREGMRKMLNKIGYSGLANKITDDMSAKQIQDGLGGINVNNLLTQHENQQNRLEMAKMRAATMGQAHQERINKDDQRRLDKANDSIQDELKRTNSAFGRMASNLQNAQAIDAMVKGTDPDKLTLTQVAEVATNLDKMLSSGGSTVSGREHFIPSSLVGKIQQMKGWTSNRPVPAEQGEYVKKLMETVYREQALAQQQVRDASEKILSSYHDLSKKHPEEWNFMLQHNGLPLDLFERKQQTQQTNKPKTVIQNGHTYNLNEQTGEYE